MQLGNSPAELMSSKLRLVTLNAMKYHVDHTVDLKATGIDPDAIRFREHIDSAAARLVMSLTAVLAAGNSKRTARVVHVSWPDGWWQAFKLEVITKLGRLGRWYLRRYPVRRKTQSVEQRVEETRMCPHIPMPSGARQGDHVKFLVDDGSWRDEAARVPQPQGEARGHQDHKARNPAR